MRLLAAIALALAAFSASAQPVSPADAAAIRKVIELQLEAFRNDDAPRAFSYATEGIREVFGSPERFMAMVKSDYPVVYRPARVAFESPEVYGGELLQPVRMTDAEGRPWIAVYPMQREADGSWRINGCRLGRISGPRSGRSI